MKKDNVSINRVKLLDGGVSGIKVWYLEKERRGNRVYLNMHPGITKRAPAHEDLINAFWVLRQALAKVYGFGMERLGEVDVWEVSFDGEMFKLVGGIKKSDAEGFLPLKTNGLLVSDVDDGELIVEQIERLFEETREYMDNGKTMGDGQLIMRLYGGKVDFDAEGFEGLPEDQKEALATKYFEKKGHVVIMAPEMIVDGEVKVSAKVLEEEVWTEELGAIPKNSVTGDVRVSAPTSDIVVDSSGEVTQKRPLNYAERTKVLVPEVNGAGEEDDDDFSV